MPVKYGMRTWIDLLESHSEGFERVSVEDVLDLLERGDIETGYWIVRAFNVAPRPLPPAFLEMLADEIEKVKASIRPHVKNGSMTVYRGVRREEDAEGVDRLH